MLCGTLGLKEGIDVVIIFEVDIFVEIRFDSDDCSSIDVDDNVKDVLERLVAAEEFVDFEEGMPETGVNVP